MNPEIEFEFLNREIFAKSEIGLKALFNGGGFYLNLLTMESLSLGTVICLAQYFISKQNLNDDIQLLLKAILDTAQKLLNQNADLKLDESVVEADVQAAKSLESVVCFKETGLFEKAIEAVRAGLDAKPSDINIKTWLYLERIDSLLYLQEIDLALSENKKVSKRYDPSDINIKALKLLMCARVNFCSGDHKSVQAIVAQCMELNPSDVNIKCNIYILLTEIYLNKRDYNKSTFYIEKAKSVNPYSNNVKADLYLTYSNLAYRQGLYQEAKLLINSGIASKPTLPLTHAGLYRNLSCTLECLGQIPEAIVAMKAGLEIKPSVCYEFNGLLQLIALYIKQDNYTQAKESIQKAFALDSIDRDLKAELYVYHAEVLIVEGNYKEAEIATLTGLLLEPSKSNIRMTLMDQFQEYARVHKESKGQKFTELSKEQQSFIGQLESRLAYFFQAYTLNRDERYDEAIIASEKGIELKGKNSLILAYLYMERSYSYFYQNKFSCSLKDIKKASSIVGYRDLDLKKLLERVSNFIEWRLERCLVSSNGMFGGSKRHGLLNNNSTNASLGNNNSTVNSQ